MTLSILFCLINSISLLSLNRIMIQIGYIRLNLVHYNRGSIFHPNDTIVHPLSMLSQKMGYNIPNSTDMGYFPWVELTLSHLQSFNNLLDGGWTWNLALQSTHHYLCITFKCNILKSEVLSQLKPFLYCSSFSFSCTPWPFKPLAHRSHQLPSFISNHNSNPITPSLLEYCTIYINFIGPRSRGGGGVKWGLGASGGLAKPCWNCLTSLAYSSASVTITSTLLFFPPCLIVFMLFHNFQVIIANSSQSTPVHISLISHIMSKKSMWDSGREGSFSFVAPHTSSAVLQPHSTGLDVSFSPHTSQLTPSSILLAFNLHSVGRIFLQALYMKCLTLFGQFKF